MIHRVRKPRRSTSRSAIMAIRYKWNQHGDVSFFHFRHVRFSSSKLYISNWNERRWMKKVREYRQIHAMKDCFPRREISPSLGRFLLFLRAFLRNALSTIFFHLFHIYPYAFTRYAFRSCLSLLEHRVNLFFDISRLQSRTTSDPIPINWIHLKLRPKIKLKRLPSERNNFNWIASVYH